jgi:acyl-coenzyme A synthetase/AMP-(fatty) acid ligase
VVNDCDPIVLFVLEELFSDSAVATLVEPGLTTVLEFGHSNTHKRLTVLCKDFPRRQKIERGHEDDPLWICYTGGSTGMPEGGGVVSPQHDCHRAEFHVDQLHCA